MSNEPDNKADIMASLHTASVGADDSSSNNPPPDDSATANSGDSNMNATPNLGDIKDSAKIPSFDISTQLKMNDVFNNNDIRVKRAIEEGMGLCIR